MTEQTMDLTISARVYTTDGDYGRLTNLVLDPNTKSVTHLVVAGNGFGHTEHVVPLALVLEGIPDMVRLRGTGREVDTLPEFIETDYVGPEFPYYDGYYDPFRNQTMSLPRLMAVPVQHQLLPPGELAVDGRARVEATDGQVGRVDEFIVDASNGDVTQLVVRQGHLWAKRDVSIAVEQIARFADDAVYLSLDKRQVGELSHVRPQAGPA